MRLRQVWDPGSEYVGGAVLGLGPGQGEGSYESTFDRYQALIVADQDAAEESRRVQVEWPGQPLDRPGRPVVGVRLVARSDDHRSRPDLSLLAGAGGVQRERSRSAREGTRGDLREDDEQRAVAEDHQPRIDIEGAARRLVDRGGQREAPAAVRRLREKDLVLFRRSHC